jgi:hypothetical protein
MTQRTYYPNQKNAGYFTRNSKSYNQSTYRNEAKRYDLEKYLGIALPRANNIHRKNGR